MKSTSRTLLFLLLAALPITLLSQNPTIILAYMKVTPGHGSDYLEVEQAWKKVHQKAIEVGAHNGWQLWRNVHAGVNDPYQYITIQWYDNYEHTFGENTPEGWMDEVYSDAEWTDIMDKTTSSRTYAYEEVQHEVTSVDDPKPVKYVRVTRMKVKPGMEEEYVKMEKEIFKPYHEELIKRGLRASWGIWNTWPYKEGQTRYTAVNGFQNVKQLTAPVEVVSPSELNLDLTMEQIGELMQKTRDMVSSELWELVDSVFPEE
jgi:hypothetical protein